MLHSEETTHIEHYISHSYIAFEKKIFVTWKQFYTEEASILGEHLSEKYLS